jgi:hypothetical protein
MRTRWSIEIAVILGLVAFLAAAGRDPWAPADATALGKPAGLVTATGSDIAAAIDQGVRSIGVKTGITAQRCRR